MRWEAAVIAGLSLLSLSLLERRERGLNERKKM